MHFLCFYGDKPVTAAEDGARRGLNATELSRVGRVGALSDERVQVSDMDRLLSLMLNGNERISSCYYNQVVRIVLLLVKYNTFLS